MAPHSILPRRVAAHARLLGSIALGIAVYFLLPWFIGGAPMRLALAWDAGVASFLLLAVSMMLRADVAGMKRRAELADSGRAEIVLLIVAAALLSLYAVATVLAGSRDLPQPALGIHVAIGVGTILLSWLFIHTLFAAHYAHLYYDAAEGKGGKPGKRIAGGLAFPADPHPDYWDFLYFSFVLGMTFQVSDVQVTSRTLRHLATAHGIIAFIYNTVVLALAVSIAANLF